MDIIRTYYPPLTSLLIFRPGIGGKKIWGVYTLFATIPSFLTYFLSNPN